MAESGTSGLFLIQDSDHRAGWPQFGPVPYIICKPFEGSVGLSPPPSEFCTVLMKTTVLSDQQWILEKFMKIVAFSNYTVFFFFTFFNLILYAPRISNI
jgi:hypothetical protein